MRHGAPLLSYTLAKARRGAQLGAVIDGAFDDGFAIDLAAAMRGEKPLEMEGGAIAFDASDSLKDMPPPGSARRLGAEQSNASVIIDDQIDRKSTRLNYSH